MVTTRFRVRAGEVAEGVKSSQYNLPLGEAAEEEVDDEVDLDLAVMSSDAWVGANLDYILDDTAQ